MTYDLCIIFSQLTTNNFLTLIKHVDLKTAHTTKNEVMILWLVEVNQIACNLRPNLSESTKL